MFSTQLILNQLTEKWTGYLYDNQFVGSSKTNLSKAFEYIPYGLLIPKLEAYVFDQTNVCYISYSKKSLTVWKNKLRKTLCEKNYIGHFKEFDCKTNPFLTFLNDFSIFLSQPQHIIYLTFWTLSSFGKALNELIVTL